jgi:hypothetical protein
MEIKTDGAQERPANEYLLSADCLQGDELPRGFERMTPSRSLLWVIVESQTRMIRDIECGSGYSLLLKHAMPRLIVTDNGRVLRNGRKGAGGNVQ